MGGPGVGNQHRRYRASPLDLAMRAKNLSRAEVAKIADLTKQTVHYYCRGVYPPKLDRAIILANLLFDGDMNKLTDCLIACGQDLPERTPK